LRKSVLFLAAAAAIVIAPMSLLLIFPRAASSMDWQNNLWMIGYDRVYFSTHDAFPPVYNVAGYVGIPQPIFYGPLLYPWLAILSEPFGEGVAVRAACLGLWGLQCWLVYRLSRVVSATRMEALVAAAATSWSVYALTNLYSRGAVAEFFGTSFLQCAVAAGGLALAEPLHQRRIPHALLAALCAAMALGSHAPTAVAGGSMLIVLALAALPWRARREAASVGKRTAVAIGMLAAALIAVSPFLYALTHTSGPLAISGPNEYLHVAGKWTRLEAADSWWARLAPLPIPQSWTAGTEQGLTPHLDAQWNFPLALLAFCACVSVTFRRRARGRRDAWPLLIASIAVTAFLLVLSISPAMQDALPLKLAAAIQFPYRLVSEVNIALLAVLIAAWSVRGRAFPSSRRSNRIILTTAVSLAALGLGMKLLFVVSDIPDDASAPAATDDRLDQLPSTFVGQHDYTVQIPARAAGQLAQETGERMEIPIGAGPLQDVQEATADFPASTWVITSVLNFPWNRLLLDGRPIPFDEVHNLYFHQAVFVTAGEHRFGYRFEPDPVWTILRYVSAATLLILAASSAVCFARRGIMGIQHG